MPTSKQETLAHLQAGRLSEARKCALHLCETHGQDPEAWFILAGIHARQGDLEAVVKACRKVLALQPENAAAGYNLGVALQTLGRFEEAADSYHQVLAHQPQHAPALANLGLAERALGHPDQAEQHCRAALHIQPDCEAALNTLGLALKDQGQLEAAIDCLRNALRLKPELASACHNLGLCYAANNDHDTAVTQYRQALEQLPDSAELHCDLGDSLKATGKTDEAVRCYRRALQLHEGFARAGNNLGLALVELGSTEEAISTLRQVTRQTPRSANAWNNLGGIYFLAAFNTRGNEENRHALLNQASDCYRQALQIDPELLKARINLGNTLQDSGFAADAVAEFSTALKADPGNREASDNHLLCLNYLDDIEPEDVAAQHSAWGKRQPRRSPQCRSPLALDKDKRLHIGYVSADLYRHPVSYFVEPLLHDYDRDRFSVTCYADIRSPDDNTARLKKADCRWCDIFSLPDTAVADQITADGIDILVDLAGHMPDNRLPLFARRPAPVQVTYLGYPNTTGLPQMDYRISDAQADPEGTTDTLYTEQLCRLPGGFLCYQPPPAAPPVAARDAQTSVVFASFNNALKTSPATVACWAQLLNRAPGSRLLLKSTFHANPRLRDHLLRLFKQYGADTSRIDLLPYLPSTTDHLAIYNQVDIALDPFPYNGTTTTCEALWMGVPVVTLAGNAHAGRVGVSLLTQVGLPDLIASDSEHYIRIAAELAADRDRRVQLRTALRPKMAASPLCDPARFVRDMETAYRHMWTSQVHPASILENQK